MRRERRKFRASSFLACFPNTIAYVPVPKDLSNVKTKVVFNLTKRQLVCFGGALLIGVPLFFLMKAHINTSAATLCMIIVMLPFFFLAMYEKNGQPMEKIARNFIQVKFLRPKQRAYETNNFYAALERQYKLEREVKRIVQKNARQNVRTKRKNTDTAQ